MRLSSFLPKMRRSHHFRLTFAVLGCLTAHALQVWIFATGFLLITWSASFLFLEMQRYWPIR